MQCSVVERITRVHNQEPLRAVCMGPRGCTSPGAVRTACATPMADVIFTIVHSWQPLALRSTCAQMYKPLTSERCSTHELRSRTYAWMCAAARAAALAHSGQQRALRHACAQHTSN